MLTVIANIFHAQRGVPTQSLLYFQVPLVVTGDLHSARVKEIEGRNGAAASKIGAESGIRSPDDARRLYEAGADAILVGEVVMRAADPAQQIRELTSWSV